MRHLLAGLLLCGASTMAAQDPALAPIAFPLNQRVRVTAPRISTRPIVGRVARVDSSRLSLTVTKKGSVLEIPLSDVTALSASGGIDRRKGMRRGALVGLVFGGWFFADSYSEISKGDYFGIGVLSLGVVSFGITPAIGALAGYGLAPERWEPVPFLSRSTLAAQPLELRLAPGEDVQMTVQGKKISARVEAQTPRTIALDTKRGSTTVSWADVTALSVRGEPSRRRGAVRGAIIAVGITAIGVATDPLPTAAENVGVVIGNAAFGALVGAFFPARSRQSLPVPR